MTFLLNRCRRRTRLTEDLVEEVWLRDHHDAMFACTVEDAISECLELSDLLRRTWDSTLDRLFSEAIDDVDGAYLVMVHTVERAICTFERLRQLAAGLSEKGYAVERFSEFSDRIVKLRELKHEIETKWPVVDHEMIAESMAAYRRGEYQPAEDLLGDAQGAGSEAD